MFQRVLHPTDFSSAADEAFQIVESLRPAGTREVILLHVQDERILKHRTAEQLAAFDQEDRSRLEEHCHKLADFGFKTRWMIRRGNPAQETVNAADEIKAGLIIIGSQGHSAIRELMTGSTLENVVRLAKQPVLIVRTQK
jgi:nucleotide-binding universal stress UspA family protein